jgi:hypothetical protein
MGAADQMQIFALTICFTVHHDAKEAAFTTIDEALSYIRQEMAPGSGQSLADYKRLAGLHAAQMNADPTPSEAPWYPDNRPGWIEHKPGDPCPVGPDVVVEVLKEEERQLRKYQFSTWEAGKWYWPDTVAYRIAKAQP